LHDLTTDRDVFFRGQRIAKEPKSLTITIDAPFFSHLRDSGSDTIVYTLDNSWATGSVYIHNISTKATKSFDARSGHIELDVSFPKRRIALTGTSTDLTVLDFDGKQVAHTTKATLQRNYSVEFSPDGERVLVVSGDNTLSIFSIAESAEPGN
jgi:WD40 repeat protein